MADIVGWYEFAYDGGSFKVCFRPGGKFFCAEYQAPASYVVEGDKVMIDWKSFGTYEMTVAADDKSMKGSTKGEPSDWRTAKFVSPLSAVETVLFGIGGGSEWTLAYDGGEFTVQFKADGYNHFNCAMYPAHSHYVITDTTVEINWDKYGEYVMTVDAAAKTMTGHTKGKPDDWRKATYLKDLDLKATGGEHAH